MIARTAISWFDRLGVAGGAPDRAATACLLLLPPALLHARGIADVLITGIGLLFLARSAQARDWAWLRQDWVAFAAAWWVWLVACSLSIDAPQPLAQAVVAVRLLLLAAALQSWLLRPPAVAAALAWVFAGCAGWLVLEVWQQYLTGSNLAGYHRAGDGILTGPFQKERAGPLLLDLFFPAVLPLAMRGLQGGRWSGRASALGLLALGAVTMVLIGQRMPNLLLLLGLGVAGLLVNTLRVAVAAVLAAIAAVAALLPVLSPPTFQRLIVHFFDQMRHFWTSDYGQVYLRAFAMAREHPWLGLGYDGFRRHCLDDRYWHGSTLLGVADAQVQIDSGCNIHPHNYWLEILTDAGWPGMLLFSALVVVWLARIGRGWRASPGPVRTAVAVAAVVVLWPMAARSSLFVVDAGGWAFLVAGWGMARPRAGDAAA